MPDAYILNALEQIREKLLDTSKRNKLLNFRINKSSLNIVGDEPRRIFEQLVSAGKSMKLMPIPKPSDEDEEAISNLTTKEQLMKWAAEKAGIDIRDEMPRIPESEDNIVQFPKDKDLQTKLFMGELEKRLRRIRSKSESVIQETGQNQLYLALGFLSWKERDDVHRSYEAPLILVPVRIKKERLDPESRCYSYSIQFNGEDLSPNLSLIEKLKKEFGLVLPDFDDEDVTVKVNGHYEVDFEKYLKVVETNTRAMDGWKVSQRSVLGFFTFAKLLMYLDLDPSRWPDSSIADHRLIGELIEGREPVVGDDGDGEQDQDGNVESLPLVADADSSQTEAIIKALKGSDMIIQGPPGTGKSQTITNLIACFMNQGKSVLFIAEKMAALEVVHRNLEKVGLSDFCFELHSHRVEKKKVLENLKKRAYRKFANPTLLESHQLELQRLREKLANYVHLIQSIVGPYDETLFDVFWKVEELRTHLQGQPVLSLEMDNIIDATDIDIRSDLLKELSLLTNTVGVPKDNIWFGYRPVVLNYDDQPVVQSKIENIDRLVRFLDNQFRNLLSRLGLETNGLELNFEHLKSIVALGKLPVPEDLLPELIGPFNSKTNLESWEKFKSSIKAYWTNLSLASESLKTSEDISSEVLCESLKVLDLIKEEGLSHLQTTAIYA